MLIAGCETDALTCKNFSGCYASFVFRCCGETRTEAKACRKCTESGVMPRTKDLAGRSLV